MFVTELSVSEVAENRVSGSGAVSRRPRSGGRPRSGERVSQK